jgi:hypothetical protein
MSHVFAAINHCDWVAHGITADTLADAAQRRSPW